MSITTTSLSNWTINRPGYSQQIFASGGTPPSGETFAITSGSAPTGLTLSSSGVLSGTPTATGPF